MPNDLLYGYPNNPYNQNMYNNPYLNLQNKISELEKRIRNLEKRISLLESDNSDKNYDYQTSMNMM